MAFPGPPPPSRYPQYPPGPPPRSPVVPVLALALLAALIAGYLLAGFLTRSQWLTGPPRDGVRVTLAANSSDGSAPSPQALAQTRDIVAGRLTALGLPDADVAVEGTGLTVATPGDDDLVRSVTAPAQLYVRPVVHAMAAQPDQHIPAPATTPAESVEYEKQLRQSTDQTTQVLALQLQAGRCGTDYDDPLATHDDPGLPLVTCSTDGKTVYLLDKSILSGAQIASAASGHQSESGSYVVDLQFTPDASASLADFTAANIGTQTAFTLDTQVVSAPAIQEAIPGGRTQISGDFTAENARALAAVLDGDPLPVALTITSSQPETFAGQPGSWPMRAALIGSGVLLVALLAGGIGYLVRRRRRPATVPPPAW